MAPIAPARLQEYRPLVAAGAPLQRQIYAQAPEIVGPGLAFKAALCQHSELPARLVELVRMRVAFHTQCRSCMAIRYQTGLDDGLTEDLVCSLEKPQEAEDLSEAEKAALAYADPMSTDHLAITDQTFDRLKEHFTDGQIMDLGFQVGPSSAPAGRRLAGDN